MSGGAILKALTIDALWAWAIIWGPKRVENRSWRTSYRGPLVIHAGQNKTRDAEALAFLRSQGLDPPVAECLEEFRGCIIGVVDLVDIVPEKETQGFPFITEVGRYLIGSDPFATGPQCWILEQPRALEIPIPATGKQGIWNLDGHC